MKLRTMKAVYCYFFPEVRPLIHFRDKISDKLFLTSTSVLKAKKILKTLFKKQLKIPSTLEGNIDLDKIHQPIINRIIEIYSPLIPHFKDFKNKYPTSGSSEGIFHLLSYLKNKGIKEIYVLKGEYEGYTEYGKTLGISTKEIDLRTTNLKKVKSGFWFISNPSARDGNIIPNNFINRLCNLNHKVILDLTYVGLTKPYKFDISHENILAAIMSFSKPYGVFRFRIGGFLFSKNKIPSLYANKWFKDVSGLLVALKIVEEIGPNKFYKKYKPIQRQIIKKINEEFNLNIKASDVFLLGSLDKKDTKTFTQTQLNLIAPFKRGDYYRFCLTPYFEKLENEKSLIHRQISTLS